MPYPLHHYFFCFAAKFWELVPDIVALLLSEMFVDNTKHAFITKFNNIPSKVYREYTALLANDVITSRKKNVSNVSCTVLCMYGAEVYRKSPAGSHAAYR